MFICQAGAAGIDLKFEHSLVETNLPIRLRADPFKLAQVFRNLISNSLKFTRANGSICVSVSLEVEQQQQIADLPLDLEMGGASSMSRNSPFGGCLSSLSSWLWQPPPLAAVPKNSSMLRISVADTGVGISVVSIYSIIEHWCINLNMCYYCMDIE